MNTDNQYEHFLKLIYCVFVVLACYTCQSTGKSISFNIYTQAGIGYVYPMQFACNYIIGPIALLFVEILVQRFRMGLVLYLGLFNAMSYLFGGMLVSYCVNNNTQIICDQSVLTTVIIIITLIGGVASTLFFVGYPIYINSISNSTNKTLYFGIAYSVYLSSTICGNTIGYFIVDYFTPFNYYALLLLILLIIQPLLIFVKDLRPQNTLPLPSVRSQYNAICSVYQNPKFLLFVPFIVTSCIVSSAYFNINPAILYAIQGQAVNRTTFLTFVCAGLGSAIGGVLCGKLGTVINQFKCAWLQISTAIIFLLIFVLAYIFNVLELCYVGGFATGMFLSGNDTNYASIISTLISDNNHYFISANACQCLGYAIASLTYIVLAEFEFKYYLIVLGVQIVALIICLVYVQIKYAKYSVVHEKFISNQATH